MENHHSVLLGPAKIQIQTTELVFGEYFGLCVCWCLDYNERCAASHCIVNAFNDILNIPNSIIHSFANWFLAMFVGSNWSQKCHNWLMISVKRELNRIKISITQYYYSIAEVCKCIQWIETKAKNKEKNTLWC